MVTGRRPRKNLYSAQQVSVVAFRMGVNSHLSGLSHVGDLWQASMRSMKTLSSWKIITASIEIEGSGVFLCLDRTFAHRIKTLACSMPLCSQPWSTKATRSSIEMGL
mmetsp:Transcript_41730/g.77229  ORF Transcript_41730/g.77229 Transcript_41730/m.77229 type:complete len:107 (-) Transcript_41730:399-719(-)